MLSLRFIRENTRLVEEGALKKGERVDVGELLRLDKTRRELLSRLGRLKHQKNLSSERIGRLKRRGQDIMGHLEETSKVAGAIKELDREVKVYEDRIRGLQMSIPNPPHWDVPLGEDARSNLLLRECAHVREFDFQPLPHWEIAERLGIIDFKRASKVSTTRFAICRGAGARLERALVNFMLDLHTSEHGYTEVHPPTLVKAHSLVGTGQLPKWEEAMFRCERDDLYLIPRGEVPLVNLHRGEVLDGRMIPISYVAATACYRREAGSYGREVRGLARQHQFDMIELVKLTRPEDSYRQHDLMLSHAEDVLIRLELPYRVNLLCTGELSFAADKSYSLEVLSAGTGKWLEVSTVSHFGDFQARRANIRFRDDLDSGSNYLHTMSGSGLAVPRVFIALLEDYQLPGGGVRVPPVLRPYMGGMEEIVPS